MKKKMILSVMIILAWCCSVHAQRLFRKPLKSPSEATTMTGANYLGVKLGVPWSVLSKTDMSEASYPGHWGYLAGIAGEHCFSHFSLGLEASWLQRGTLMNIQSTYQISLTDEGTLTKEISAVYDVAAIRVPLTYYLTGDVGKKKIAPYLYLAPSVEIPLPICFQWDKNSVIPHLSEPTITHTTQYISTTSATQAIRPGLNAGVSAGIGVLTHLTTGGSSMLIKVDAGMNQGLVNMATSELKQKGVLILSQSLEASLTVLFQLKKPLHDACHAFRK